MDSKYLLRILIFEESGRENKVDDALAEVSMTSKVRETLETVNTK